MITDPYTPTINEAPEMLFMAPAMLFAALVPVGALLFVQAEHDTRGFTDVPSPDEAVAEQIRRQNAAGNGTRRQSERREDASGTRSREVLLKGGAGDFAPYDRRGDYVSAAPASISRPAQSLQPLSSAPAAKPLNQKRMPVEYDQLGGPIPQPPAKRNALPVPTSQAAAPLAQAMGAPMGAPMGGAPGTEMTPQECAALGLPPGSRWAAQNASSGIRGDEQQGLSTRSSYQPGGSQVGGDASAGGMHT